MSWKVSNRFPRNANTQSHEKNPYDEALIIQQEFDLGNEEYHDI